MASSAPLAFERFVPPVLVISTAEVLESTPYSVASGMGARARQRGVPQALNPFPPKTAAYVWWRRAWRAAGKAVTAGGAG
jgi:hypothetical protein